MNFDDVFGAQIDRIAISIQEDIEKVENDAEIDRDILVLESCIGFDELKERYLDEMSEKRHLRQVVLPDLQDKLEIIRELRTLPQSQKAILYELYLISGLKASLYLGKIFGHHNSLLVNENVLNLIGVSNSEMKRLLSRIILEECYLDTDITSKLLV